MDVNKVPLAPTPEPSPLLGALLTVAGLVARHGLAAEQLRVEDDGARVVVEFSPPELEPLEAVQAQVNAWATALGTSRVNTGGPIFPERSTGRAWMRAVSTSGRVGQLDVIVTGFGTVAAPQPEGVEVVAS